MRQTLYFEFNTTRAQTHLEQESLDDEFRGWHRNLQFPLASNWELISVRKSGPGSEFQVSCLCLWVKTDCLFLGCQQLYIPPGLLSFLMSRAQKMRHWQLQKMRSLSQCHLWNNICFLREIMAADIRDSALPPPWTGGVYGNVLTLPCKDCYPMALGFHSSLSPR